MSGDRGFVVGQKLNAISLNYVIFCVGRLTRVLFFTVPTPRCQQYLLYGSMIMTARGLYFTSILLESSVAALQIGTICWVMSVCYLHSLIRDKFFLFKICHHCLEYTEGGSCILVPVVLVKMSKTSSKLIKNYES